MSDQTIHARLDLEAKRLVAAQDDGVTRVSDSFINGVEHAANIAYRAETGQYKGAVEQRPAVEVPAMDKQVVHARGRRFSALVNSGVDMREFDRGLAALGIELVITDTRGLVAQSSYGPFVATSDAANAADHAEFSGEGK